MSRPKTKKDKHTEVPEADAGASADGAITPEPAPVMVTVVRTGQALKLNPARSGGAITYQVGRIDGVGLPGVVIRLKENEGGGQFSKEWVSIERMRACFTPAVLAGGEFRSHALQEAFKGRSSTNSGFLTAVIRAEGLAYEDVAQKGVSRLSDRIETWIQCVLDAEPEKNEDGTVKQEPLVPPKRENPFAATKGVSAKKAAAKRSLSVAGAADADTSDSDYEDADAADAEMCTTEA
jgi:hypothetical protein